MRPILAVALLGLLSALPVYADSLLTQAENHLQQQQFKEALALLAPVEDDRAGEPAYDYLLGLAYLNLNETTLATFAFERCLATDPNHGPCRVQMARTHFAMREYENGRKELYILQAYNPPAAVQQLIQKYLGADLYALAKPDPTARSQAYLQFGVAYDSNINSATDQRQIALPSLPISLNVNPNSQQQDGLALQGQIAANYLHPLAKTWLAQVNTELHFHDYQDHSEYSYQTLNLDLGLMKKMPRQQWATKVQLQKTWLGGDTYRDVIGGLAQYQFMPNKGTQFTAYTQLSQLNYEVTTRDSQRLSTGVAYAQAFARAYQPVFYSGVYVGQDQTDDDSFDAYSYDFWGIRTGGSLTIAPKLQVNAGLNYEDRQFGDVFPLFQQTREDQELNLNIGMTWQLNEATRVQPNYSLIRNQSTIVLTDYERHIVAVDIRFDF
ncbi:surface lipoprotein assembly modifier [Agitococcus lubricus]|uniref:Uncharacterized protein DUF560 n=1 Tax=Agitococcus lubricus TaxID=1077255 RepID=A0A2T5IUE8_9GAMM|nr:surface lipoprotein assembly modifier [Agitococcus lubricus]PTQ87509.1 uncharacterized protein DUF560 [Agitococcus lubricus]